MSQAVIISEASKTFQGLNPIYPARLTRRLAQPGVSAAPVLALDRVSLSIQAGEIIGIVGPSGAGKTTLLRLLAALLEPDHGRIELFGVDAVNQPALAQRLVNPIAAERSFFKQLSLLDNLAYGALPEGRTRGQVRTEGAELLRRLGVAPLILHQPMAALSESYQQIVSLGRALLRRPRLLLLDEPTRGLDLAARQALHAALDDLRRTNGVTILIATRDAQAAALLCDRLFTLENGRLVSHLQEVHKLSVQKGVLS